MNIDQQNELWDLVRRLEEISRRLWDTNEYGAGERVDTAITNLERLLRDAERSDTGDEQ